MSCAWAGDALTLRVFQVLVERLHSVLRPFLLRRLKRDVEKQLPGKHEHIIKCRLSKRQRTLYEDYMAASDVRSTLSSGNFLGIINVLMQLRKVRWPLPGRRLLYECGVGLRSFTVTTCEKGGHAANVLCILFMSSLLWHEHQRAG